MLESQNSGYLEQKYHHLSFKTPFQNPSSFMVHGAPPRTVLQLQQTHGGTDTVLFCLPQALKCICQQGEGKKNTSESILKPSKDSGSSAPTLTKGQAENPSSTFSVQVNTVCLLSSAFSVQQFRTSQQMCT